MIFFSLLLFYHKHSAPVEKILFNEKGRAIGVVVESKGKQHKFYARKGIISTAGFHTTFTKLAPINELQTPTIVPLKFQQNVNRALNELHASVQHFQCFIGLNKSSKELNLPSHNCWNLQFNESITNNFDFNYDKFIQSFHKDPLNGPILALVGFPSAKDPEYNKMFGENKSVCVIVTEVPRYHFEQWSKQPCGGRSKEYEDFKKKIGNRLIEELLFKQFPQTRDCISKIKFGTALSADYYLGNRFGESYGLHNSVERYFDWDISKVLKPDTEINGLYISGQDTVCCGWAGALHSGLVCAERILGYHKIPVFASGRTLLGDLEKMNNM